MIPGLEWDFQSQRANRSIGLLGMGPRQNSAEGSEEFCDLSKERSFKEPAHPSSTVNTRLIDKGDSDRDLGISLQHRSLDTASGPPDSRS